jgi:CRISPR-associated protein Cas1
MEEFRTIVVETLTLSLFNLKILTSDDFYLYKPKEQENLVKQEREPDILKDPIAQMGTVPQPHDTAEERELLDLDEEEIENWKKEKVYPVRLKEDALKKLLHQFERKMKTRFYYDPLRRPIDYQKAIYEQAKQYAKLIKGEIAEYKPLQMQ